MFIGDTFLSLVPVIFIILAFRALAVDGEPSSPTVVTRFYKLLKLHQRYFPIIFAAVVGRLMRTYALWKAERGTRLGVLEQLGRKPESTCRHREGIRPEELHASWLIHHSALGFVASWRPSCTSGARDV